MIVRCKIVFHFYVPAFSMSVLIDFIEFLLPVACLSSLSLSRLSSSTAIFLSKKKRILEVGKVNFIRNLVLGK